MEYLLWLQPYLSFNKMKLYRSISVLFFLFTIGSFVLFSQEVNINWGENVDLQTTVLKIVGQTEHGLYALTTRKKKFYVEYFAGESFQRKFATELPFKVEDGIDSELAELFYLEDNLLLFTSTFDKKNKTYRIFGYRLNNEGKVASERLEVLTAQFEKKRRAGEIGFRTSGDLSKLLVYHSAPHKKTSESWQVNMKIITSNLEVIKDLQSEFPLENEDEQVEISNFLIKDNGAVYMAARQMAYEKKLLRTKNLWIRQFEPSNGFDEETLTIDLNDKSASSVALTTDPEGNLIGAGFYSERSPKGVFKYDGLAGTYFIKIDPLQKEVLSKTIQPFGQEFAASVLKEKQADKGKLVPNFFQPREIIPKEDGGAVMVAEYFSIVITENNSSRTTTTTHGPLAVVDIAPSGDINWVRSIPKRQVFQKTDANISIGGFLGGVYLNFGFWLNLAKDQTVYHSYVTGISGESLYFLYNDHPKNIEIEHFRNTTALVGFKKSVPVVIQVDGAGEMQKSILGGVKADVVLRPMVSLQDRYDEVLIYGTRKKEEKFGKILFE